MKQLKNSNMPSRLPFELTLVAWLSIDHWHGPLWLYGAVGTILLIAWVAVIFVMATAESVDIIERVEALEKEQRALKSRM